MEGVLIRKKFYKFLIWLLDKDDQKQSVLVIKILFRPGEKITNRFKALMEQSGESDPTQVVREAIRVYEHLVLEERLGTKFYTKDKETGRFIPHPFFKDDTDED